MVNKKNLISQEQFDVTAVKIELVKNKIGAFMKYLNSTEIKGLKIEDQCDVCKHNGYFNEAIIGNIKLGIPTVVKPVELFYNNVDAGFLKQSEVFLSWEHMGKSNLVAHDKYVVRYARPLLIVSELFYNFLTSKGVKNFEVEKINFAPGANIASATLVSEP